jgi:lysophospholipase L1-like esterase
MTISKASLCHLVLCVAAIAPAAAELVVEEVSSREELAFVNDVSESDLLHGLKAEAAGWKLENGATPEALNDGAHGASFDKVGAPAVAMIAWTAVGATATYNLGPGPSGDGWDLTTIRSIAAWNGAGFGNQAYKVEVKALGAEEFVLLAKVDYQPLTSGVPSDPGATKVTLTDDRGVLARRVEFIRFTADAVQKSQGGSFTFREIDVEGVAFKDSDGDGLSDSFERAHSSTASTTALKPGDDPDADGLSNLQEFQSGSDPTKADSDGDTLGDAAEVAGADTRPPTNPALADSDGDGLDDNLETGTGNYAGPTDTGSDPTKADSDGDGSKDGVEVAAGKNPNDPASKPVLPLRIMPVGDSITVGYTDNPSWAKHPFKFGYRGGLYTRLTDAGYKFQFVGASTEPWTGISGDPTHAGTVTPALDLRKFGQEAHRGYGGAGIGAITARIGSWIAVDEPDLILLMIGINGISPSSPAALDKLVATIFATAPEVHLVVAQITPYGQYNKELHAYNTHIRERLVPTQAAKGRDISTVDLHSLFLSDPADPKSIAPGRHANAPHNNHPTNTLYDQMAKAWFKQIQRLGLREK